MTRPLATEILGHRGASADHPENTLRALRAALEQGADGVEFDVRLDSAGTPRVFHDAETERLTGTPGRFDAHPSSVLETLRVRDEPIPTLAAALEALRSAHADPSVPLTVNVELKTDRDPQRLVAACRALLDPAAADPAFAMVVSSFDPRVLVAARDTPWRLALLYEDAAALAALPYLERPDKPLDLHPRHDLITAEHLAEYAAPARRFRTWTVDDAAEARRLIGLGITAIITNRPGALRATLSPSQQDTPR